MVRIVMLFCDCLLLFIRILSTELQVGFEMDQYTFSEGAGQVTIYIIRENNVIISENFTVEVAMLTTNVPIPIVPTPIATESMPHY